MDGVAGKRFADGPVDDTVKDGGRSSWRPTQRSLAYARRVLNRYQQYQSSLPAKERIAVEITDGVAENSAVIVPGKLVLVAGQTVTESK